ncbi:hypothetical protein BsWGS_27246 [Bradybaena similaris]
MAESLSNPNLDTKNANAVKDDDSRVSYTSRFKIMSSRYGRPKTRFGGYGVTETSQTTSTLPRDKKSQPARKKDENSSRHTPSTAVRRSSKSDQTLFKMTNEKRSRRIRLYRNGDRFFKGMLFAVSSERFRTFESLLTALTASPVCDKRVMPNGVRHIFTLDGTRLQGVEELVEGESYVCGSGDSFRAIDYSKIESPVWNSGKLPCHKPNRGVLKKAQNMTAETTTSHTSDTISSSSSQSQVRPASARDKGSCQSEKVGSASKSYEDFQRTVVSPRLITLVRNGRRPRKVARLLLNKKTAQSLEQVMSDITQIVSFDCGQAKKVYTMAGQQVMCLADFFQDDTVFLVCAQDKPSAGDFILDSHEARQARVHRPFEGKIKERASMRGSSVASSKSSKSSLPTSNDVPQENTKRPHDHGDVPKQKTQVKTSDKENVESYLSNLPMPKVLTNKYEIGRPIGTGNFAVVLECRDRRTKRKYALKIINREFCKGKAKMIDNEVRILRCMKHPNIIRLLEDYTNRHQIFYVMELVQGGDLFDAISSSTGKYTEYDASSMLYNLASALQYLHSLHIVHRDVKPENILVSKAIHS